MINPILAATQSAHGLPLSDMDSNVGCTVTSLEVENSNLSSAFLSIPPLLLPSAISDDFLQAVATIGSLDLSCWGGCREIRLWRRTRSDGHQGLRGAHRKILRVGKNNCRPSPVILPSREL